MKKFKIEFPLLSNSSMDSARSLGIAFKVSKQFRDLLTRYKIDLQKASGENHYQLPVPAVILVGKDNKIQFIHVNPDYRQRLAPKVILALAQSLSK